MGRVIRLIRSLKSAHDRREWLLYLRREAVVRALNPRGGIVTEEIGEAADQICEVLDRTDIPFETRDGLVNRTSRWTREKVTRGIRFPEYTGPQGATFLERLGRWVFEAARSAEVEQALDRAGFPAGEGDQRRRLFAVAVVQEVRGLLSESRRPEAQNMIRFRMATSVFNGTPEREIQAHHARWRVLLHSLMAGIAAGLSAEFLFNNTLEDALGFGTTVAVVNAVREAAQTGVARLSPDVLAFRRQITAWLRRLPDRMLRRMEGPGAEPAGDVSETADPLWSVLHALDVGTATIGRAAEETPELAELAGLIRRAGEMPDLDARAHLLDVETALQYETADLPTAVTRLVLFLAQDGDGGGRGARGIPAPRPSLDPAPRTAPDGDLLL
ncbi:hypothetical protein [Streptomyces sp. WAC05374]|uniref:hypothetical protein n=1 Tax=Streptomyces sp. WAC05374 TaxID=2487420 RepID=UPI000F8997F2|nr:hypothetical protein [Streptomyces sp. WAC05374]RST15174.1 hypothetical protein EF905_15630 [Streptomyces sp. WAC05374]